MKKVWIKGPELITTSGGMNANQDVFRVKAAGSFLSRWLSWELPHTVQMYNVKVTNKTRSGMEVTEFGLDRHYDHHFYSRGGTDLLELLENLNGFARLFFIITEEQIDGKLQQHIELLGYFSDRDDAFRYKLSAL